MCLLVALNGVSFSFPLILATNRDEFFDRPSSVPERLAPNVVGPKDLVKGGTWVGVTRDGFIGALTNQDDDDGYDETLATSRGLVLLEALEKGPTAGAWDVIKRLNPSDYNPFNVLAGRAEQLKLYTISYRGIEMRPLGIGTHVITNDCHNDLYSEKVSRAKDWAALVDPLESDAWVIIRHMSAMLQDHATERDNNPHMSMCVHDADFGTRSSTIILIDKRGVPRIFHSVGPACSHSFYEYSDMLSDPRDQASD